MNSHMANFSASLNTLSRRFSEPSISRFANPGFNFRMDIKQIRRGNMLALIEREPSKAAFARKVGTDPAYISQILSTKTKAEVGNDLARAIEAAYELPHGWMDQEHGRVADSPVEPDLIAAWGLLTPSEKGDLLATIKQKAAHNKEVMEMAAPKVVRVADRRQRQVNFDLPERRKHEKEG